MSKRAADTVEAIWEHWVVHGDVPADRADEMRDELAQHLTEAEADGKRVADVTGTDLRAFADEWARHEREMPQRSVPSTLIVAALAGACGLTFAKVVFDRSLDVSFPVVEGALAIVALATLAYLVLGPPGTRLRRSSTPMPKGVKAVLSGLAGGGAFILVTGLTAVIGSNWVVEVPRILVGLMATIGGGLMIGLPMHAIGISPLRLLRRITR